jgi:hypothetical protein
MRTGKWFENNHFFHAQMLIIEIEIAGRIWSIIFIIDAFVRGVLAWKCNRAA